jgi:hypothetical protein
MAGPNFLICILGLNNHEGNTRSHKYILNSKAMVMSQDSVTHPLPSKEIQPSISPTSTHCSPGQGALWVPQL